MRDGSTQQEVFSSFFEDEPDFDLALTRPTEPPVPPPEIITFTVYMFGVIGGALGLYLCFILLQLFRRLLQEKNHDNMKDLRSGPRDPDEIDEYLDSCNASGQDEERKRSLCGGTRR